MSRVTPLSREELSPEDREFMEFAENLMGFTANDVLTMARQPALLKASAALVGATYKDGKVDVSLKRLIAHITSSAAGCTYCKFHTAHGAHLNGIESEKIAAAWEYETSPLFTDAERSALRIAQGGGVTPSAVTDADFEEARKYFDDDQLTEIVSVIALFGFLNRWNSVMDTTLEDKPLAFAKTVGLS